jgi:hypothetical protein
MNRILFIVLSPISSIVIADDSLICPIELLDTRTIDRDRIPESIAQYWRNFPSRRQLVLIWGKIP